MKKLLDSWIGRIALAILLLVLFCYGKVLITNENDPVTTTIVEVGTGILLVGGVIAFLVIPLLNKKK